jgi:chorismate-pyruvate lyase
MLKRNKPTDNTGALLEQAAHMRWQRATPASLHRVPEPLRTLLSEHHSLTAALRHQYGGDLHTQLMELNWRYLTRSLGRSQAQRCLTRRLRMYAGERQVLEAVSLLPASMLARPAFRHLSLLGDRALGDAVFGKNGTAMRSELLIAHNALGWWRSSQLLLGRHSITLLELFPF